MTYDSRPDTYAHIQTVQRFLNRVISELLTRSEEHDQSKLASPEKEVFDEFTPKLRDTTYGSEEYKEFLVAMKPALDHHYAHNRHHPEHFPDGIDGMSLLDVIEMTCADWPAAVSRHKDGDLLKSLEINRTRFGLSDQVVNLIRNTWIQLDLLPVRNDVATQIQE